MSVLGILLPEGVVYSRTFAVLAGFVAINTVMYVALSIGKTLPRVNPGAWLPRRRQRGETRSIFPDAPH